MNGSPTASSWRRRLIFLALAATLAAAAWVSRQEAPVSAPPSGRSGALRTPTFPTQERQAAAVPAQLVLSLPERPIANDRIVDLFRDSAVPSGRASGGAEKPAAPPLPFVFMGRYVERGVTHVFLEQGEQMHMVKVGDIIDHMYRVERIDSAIRLMYLPTKEMQSLEIGDLQ